MTGCACPLPRAEPDRLPGLVRTGNCNQVATVPKHTGSQQVLLQAFLFLLEYAAGSVGQQGSQQHQGGQGDTTDEPERFAVLSPVAQYIVSRCLNQHLDRKSVV